MEVCGYTANIVATVLMLGYINSEEIILYRVIAFKIEFLPDLVWTV
jgi:hypothetical protein